jgi:transcriptional regulator with XRE-family HTH domain
MDTVGTRLKALRHSTGMSQTALAKIADTNQSSINRYEQDQSEVPYRILLWYADHFDISLDYIFCRTDNPHGKYYEYQPERVKEKLQNKAEWSEFIEACFEEGSPLNTRLKDMFIKLAGEDEK